MFETPKSPQACGRLLASMYLGIWRPLLSFFPLRIFGMERLERSMGLLPPLHLTVLALFFSKARTMWLCHSRLGLTRFTYARVTEGFYFVFCLKRRGPRTHAHIQICTGWMGHGILMGRGGGANARTVAAKDFSIHPVWPRCLPVQSKDERPALIRACTRSVWLETYTPRCWCGWMALSVPLEIKADLIEYRLVSE
jgi:hypothetical protein